MGDTGLEQTPLAGPKTPISQTGGAKSGALDDRIYPDLAEIVKAWPELPEHIKASILALVKTHGPGKGRSGVEP